MPEQDTRFDPTPIRDRMTRDRVTHVTLAERTPWTAETVGSLVRGNADRNGRRGEGLTWWQADRLAIAIGYHPSEIWPEWSMA